jgi:hypothetical protein
MLNAVAASTAASVPNPQDASGVPMADKSEIELQLRDVGREIVKLELILNAEKDPQEREKLRRLVEIFKEKERNFRALAKTPSPHGAEK